MRRLRHVLVGVLLVALVPLWLPVLLLVWVSRYLRGMYLRYSFKRAYGKAGKFMIFVYSDSPHWKERIERLVLPRIDRYAVVLNWSERSTDAWPRGSVEVRVFEFWGGPKEFNPLAIMLPPRGRPEALRFWHPYRHYKHGRTAPLEQLESELFAKVATVAGQMESSGAQASP